MNDKQLILETLRRMGKTIAADLQTRSSGMTGTEIIAEEDYLPSFDAAIAKTNMLNRSTGFVCKSAMGNAVKLLQPYDSTVYTQQPEELPAQWGFYWTTDPKKAKPFIALSTSPFNTGDCCTYEGHVWRSGQDNNVWAPGTVNVQWDDLGVIGGEFTYPDGTDQGTDTGSSESQGSGTGSSESQESGTGDEQQGYPVWTQPTGAHDAYNKGDIVNYNGTLYESLIDGNTYSPEAYPAGWKEVAA